MTDRTFFVVFILCLSTFVVKAQLNVCPIQGLGRRIQSGDPLIQCLPFFQNGACCLRNEEQAVFNKFSELRFVGSDQCVQLMNNLMCYICSPDQANWYSANNTVTVCSEFCELLWSHCYDAQYYNTRLSSLYREGWDFCHRQGFEVIRTIPRSTNHNCYNAHSSLIPQSGSVNLKISGMFVSFVTIITYISLY